MSQSFAYKPNSCGSFKVCPPKNLGKQFFNIILDSVDQIPFPLKQNAIYFVRDGLAFDMYEVNDAGTELIARPFLTQNISVIGLVEESLVTHKLQTVKIEATFYDTNNRQVREIDFEPISENQIKIYLPILESGASTFTGDIYLKRRS